MQSMSALRKKSIRLRFTLERARLYAFESKVVACPTYRRAMQVWNQVSTRTIFLQ
jgi:hypothetical protein